MNRFFIRFPGFKRKALTLSFDDGVAQDVKMVGVLNRYGIKCTFNINSGMLDAIVGRRRLGRSEIEHLYDGHEVALHSLRHPFLDELPKGVAAYEIVKDREIFEEIFGQIIRGLAYPMGTCDDFTVDTLRACNVLYARTTAVTHKFDIPKKEDWLRLPSTCHHTDPKLLDLCDEFLDLKPTWGSKLFYVWGHSYEFDENDNWSLLDEFCEKMAGKEDIYYGTNKDIFEYIEAAGNLVTSVEGSILYNPTAYTLYLEEYTTGLQYVLKPGETKMFN